jgi:hypothetical protein
MSDELVPVGEILLYQTEDGRDARRVPFQMRRSG